MSKRILLSTVICLSFYGCGGGGGTSTSVPNPPIANSLSGVVATGAPIANASVTIVDSLGNQVGTTTTDSNGYYVVNLGTGQFTPPYVIKANGISADSGITLVGVAGAAGTANINQITNAISASISSTGNPTDLLINQSGTPSVTSVGIASADNAFQVALSAVLTAAGKTGSFISGTFNDAYDTLLDNVTANVMQNGQIVLSTTAGKMSADLAVGSSSTSPYTSVTLLKGNLPDSSAAASLTALGTMISVRDLESLRSNLQTCFSYSAANRGNPTAPSSACSDSKFVATTDYTQANGFKHSSYMWSNPRWNDPTFNPTSTVNPYYYGLFGTMLVSSKYDGAKFLTPRIIRPLDSAGTSWIVQFPIKFSDGTLDSFGDSIGTFHTVVKRIPNLVSSSDNGIRFVGDSRDFMVRLDPVIQKVVRPSGTSYETGLTAVISNRKSSTDAQGRKVVLAQITGKGLPQSGIFYAQNSNSNCGSLGLSFLTDVVYGSLPNTINLNLSQLNTLSNNGSLNWSSIYFSGVCAGVFRMAASSPWSGAFSSPGWGNDGSAFTVGVNDSGTVSGGNSPLGGFVSNSDISNIKIGEPYVIKFWLSDGSTLNYTNRLNTNVLNLAEAVAYNGYPSFDQTTASSFANFNGSSSSFRATLNPNSVDGYTYSVGLFWSGTSLFNQVAMPYGQSSVDIPCLNSCTVTNNWLPSSGMLKAFSRTVDRLQVYTQLWN